LWEWKFIIINMGNRCKCLFNEICDAAKAKGKSELCDSVVTVVSDSSVAYFSRLGERVRRLAEDAAFLSRRFLCLSGFPSFSLFLRTLKHHKRLSSHTKTLHINPTQMAGHIPRLMHAKDHNIPVGLHAC